MCGQAGYYGTNAFSLLLDMKAILNLEEKQLAEGGNAVDFNFTEEDNNAMKIDIDNNVRNIQSVDIGKMDDDYSLFQTFYSIEELKWDIFILQGSGIGNDLK